MKGRVKQMTRGASVPTDQVDRTIEFNGPPPPEDRQRGPSSQLSEFWLDVAVRCRALIGEWAYVGRHHASQSTRINRGEIAAFRPAGHFQATTRGSNDDDPRARLWVRYVADTTPYGITDTELPEDQP